MSSTDIEPRDPGDLAQQQASPQQRVLATIRSADFQRELATVLPEGVTPQRFSRIATTALLQSPDIAECTPDSIVYALLRAAADGLMPDGRQAALVAVGSKTKLPDGRETWVKKADYRPMITGFVRTAGEHGWTLDTHVVYENDEFDYTEEPPSITHRPVRPGGERGELIAAYAIAKHRDGRRLQRVLHPDDVARRRKRAQTQKVWEEHPAAMWAKSAGRDLFADLPLDPSDKRAALDIDDFDVATAKNLLFGPGRSEAQPQDRKTILAGMADILDPNQQAAGAAPYEADASQGGQASDVAPAAPGPDDEPPPPDSTVATSDDDPVVMAAKHAAMFVIPNGQWKDIALGELLAKGDKGTGWLRWALRRVETPAAFKQAVWDFSRVYAPDLYTEILAEKEAA